MSTKWFQLTFWKAVFLLIVAAGLYSTYVRFTAGLGASTNLSDEYPWGIWIGFDVLCGVALAAGGFTISAIVYVFHLERFKPIVRPAILTAFLGYLLVIIALMYDLGRPYRIWHALVMWNPNSVMFEVAWCVMLYTTVLALEFSPVLFEKLRWEKPLKIARSVTVPLVIIGVLLSMLHQSSLGTLFLIVPGKLHPLWYSPFLPVFFFISAIALGCTMTVFESFLSSRAFGRRIEMDLLSTLGKVTAVVLGLYLLLKYLDLSGRGFLALAFAPTYEGRMFQLEMLLGVLVPMVLLLIPRVRSDRFGLFAASVMVVLGIVMNRLNVTTTALEGYAGPYFPSWTELSVTAMIIALGFALFYLAAKYLPVFPAEQESEEPVELPAVDFLRAPLARPRVPVLSLGVLLMVGAAVLGVNGYHSASGLGADSHDDEVDISAALRHLVLPDPIEIPMSEDSPGPVIFNHDSHVDLSSPRCDSCHSGLFPIVNATMRTTGAPAVYSKDMHESEACGACHDGHKAFDARDDCAACHQ
jgi:c(7)-type cytochrome triheme protein